MNRLLTVLGVVAVLIGVVPWAGADEEDSAENSLRVFYDKGFRFNSRDGKFALRLNGLLQVRHTYVDYDPETRYNQEDYSNFYVRRARLFFSGHAGSPRFTFLFQAQLEPNQGLNANDLWVEYEFSDLVRLGAGRNKISYGLEFMNSGSALGMVDRSVLNGETDIDLGDPTTPGPRYPGGGTYRFGLNWLAETGFATGGMNLYRSQGIQLRGHRGTSSTPTFEYQVGLWQGRGTNSLSNGGNQHLAAVRVGYHPGGFVDWKVVGDFEDTPHFKLGVIGSAYVNSETSPYSFDESGYNLAAIARYRGWSLDVEWGTETYDYEVFADDFDREGSRLAVGWYVVPSRLEVRARYAEITRMVDPTYQKAIDSGLGVPEVWGGEAWTTALENTVSEISAAVSYYLPGWRNKVAVDVSRLQRQFAADPNAVINGIQTPIEKAPDQVDYRWRVMVQLVF
ncbi:MAG: porin [Acidobacteriota bacterium]|nr:porin [Acidobacteriota bacterium]